MESRRALGETADAAGTAAEIGASDHLQPAVSAIGQDDSAAELEIAGGGSGALPMVGLAAFCVLVGVLIFVRSSRSRGRNKYTRVSLEEEGATMGEEAAGADPRAAGGWTLSSNSKILLVAIAAFGTISVAQLIGALVANSLALMGDVASMAVDTATYVGNLFAECSESTSAETQERNQLAASFVSLLVLVAVSLTVVFDAAGRIEASMLLDDSTLNMTALAAGEYDDIAPEIAAAELAEEEEEVDPYIVCGFAVAGLVLDCSTMAAFHFWGKGGHGGGGGGSSSGGGGDGKRVGRAAAKVAAGAAAKEAEAGKQEGGGQEPEVALKGGAPHQPDLSAEPAEDLNMMSAFLHVFADSLRSFTTLVEAALIGIWGFEGRETDGFASLFVSGTILIGATVAFREWLRQFALVLAKRQASAGTPVGAGAAGAALELDKVSDRSVERADSCKGTGGGG
eukprot:SAG22_NODE_3342_length_1768_cov_2.124026_1_plen_453_part_10